MSSYADIIQDELRRYGAQQYSDSMWICCPFHGETKPSLSVATSDAKVMIGSFYCFGCQRSGNWNVLARELGFETINIRFLSEERSATVKKPPKQVYHDHDTEKFLRGLGFTSFVKWPEPNKTNIRFFKDWYGIPGSLLHKLEAYLVKERKGDIHRMFLPVKVHNLIYGGVRVLYRKQKDSRTYLNTDGDWAKSYGLFPYDFVHDTIKTNKHKFIVLVEGPRDALRLILLGFPAVAILGSQSFDKKKALIVCSTSCIDTVYCMPDSDAGGNRMFELVRTGLKNQIRLKNIRLPVLGTASNQKHTDPNNVPIVFLRMVAKKLNLIHGSSISF